jgi:hypothetical protein
VATSPEILARWSSADLALFLTCGSLDAPSSAECFAELVRRGVPMVSQVPQCAHVSHVIDEFGDRIGLDGDYLGAPYVVCALHTFGA